MKLVIIFFLTVIIFSCQKKELNMPAFNSLNPYRNGIVKNDIHKIWIKVDTINPVTGLEYPYPQNYWEYDKNGNLVKLKGFWFEEIYYYDSVGSQLISKNTHTCYFDSSIYKQNYLGDKKFQVYIYSFEVEEKPIDSIEYQLDEHGNIIKETYSDGVIEYSYNENNQLVKQVELGIAGKSNWIRNKQKNFPLEKKGNKLTTEFLYKNGKLIKAIEKLNGKDYAIIFLNNAELVDSVVTFQADDYGRNLVEYYVYEKRIY